MAYMLNKHLEEREVKGNISSFYELFTIIYKYQNAYMTYMFNNPLRDHCATFVFLATNP